MHRYCASHDHHSTHRTRTWGSSESPSELHLGAEAVKVLAHPLRSRIVTQLRRSGPATATALAASLGTNSGATSYHLRRLETVGLVEDTDTGKGKERLWRAAVEQHSWTQSDFVDDEDAQTALNWLERDYVRHFADQGRAVARRAAGLAGGVGRRISASTTTSPWSPLDQLRAMRAEIEDVLLKYRRVGQGNPQAKRVAVYTYAYPVDLDQSPRGDRR